MKNIPFILALLIIFLISLTSVFSIYSYWFDTIDHCDSYPCKEEGVFLVELDEGETINITWPERSSDSHTIKLIDSHPTELRCEVLVDGKPVDIIWNVSYVFDYMVVSLNGVPNWGVVEPLEDCDFEIAPKSEIELCPEGCFFHGKCYTIGGRVSYPYLGYLRKVWLSEWVVPSYCSSLNTFLPLKKEFDLCSYDYECEEGNCKNTICLNEYWTERRYYQQDQVIQPFINGILHNVSIIDVVDEACVLSVDKENVSIKINETRIVNDMEIKVFDAKAIYCQLSDTYICELQIVPSTKKESALDLEKEDFFRRVIDWIKGLF